MERTVPSTASEEIELYVRTVYSLLRATSEVQIRSLEEVHASMNSSLHPEARKTVIDTSALIYSLLRLPECIFDVRTVILGQSSTVFAQHGYDVESWQPVVARARRRRCFLSSDGILACFIASRSDIDDVMPTLTALQIEWNKLHHLLKRLPEGVHVSNIDSDPETRQAVLETLEISAEDLDRLRTIWGKQFTSNLITIQHQQCALRVRNLSSSHSEYRRATSLWWDNIQKRCPQITQRPLYIVSSNTHSLVNLLTGFALRHQDEMITFLHKQQNTALLAEWNDIISRQVPSSQENFLYYLLKKYQQSPEGAHLVEEQKQDEIALGIQRIPSEHSFDIDAQVIDLARLNPHPLDPRLCNGKMDFLPHSNALILNIDYPLGLAAYNILSEIAEHNGSILGLYIMGKAASLNGVRGDVLVPNVVHDEHSHNTYLFQNAFSATDVSPYLVYGTVLDNQKSVTVLGTFLQNARIMDVVYREGYTDIEMEAGPYLSAVYEMVRPVRYPTNEIINLYGANLDLGVLHYVSDTPLSKGKNLGAATLSYFGMDSTYATTLAIARRIIARERQRFYNERR
ncbi:MAG TPA: hypothetical protein PKW33_14720 [Anaerolineaceae bacterium]|nr:hypothetical protein [Anaerolineaceae bacterium]HPN52844.1 hypothetical protein [Anaerolineaceae bacterium]